MAPAASRFAATGLALGLASTFVVPSTPSTKPVGTVGALRGAAVETNPTAKSTHLAALAAASVSLAAVGAGVRRTSTKATFQPSQQIGASEPLGFFDPLEFTKVGDEQGFRKLRTSEIKHGRLAMMASIGLVAQHYWKLPGFENLPSGFSVLGTQEGLLGLFALFLVSGCLENSWREDPNGAKEPGNFGDPFGLQMYTQDMRMKELNNGRMAMISVLGIFAAEMVSGKDAIQQFGLQALGRGQLRSSGSSFTGKTSAQSAQSQFVTRRAFQPSQQIGASEPLGFFDPLEFTKVGDEQGFRKLRTSEIKHGRLAMMASIGLVAQHYWKLPGFENLPSGFSVLGTQEGLLGLFALFLVSGCLENSWREDPNGAKEPGNFGDPFGLQMYTQDMRMKELNNGRMAMISVLGIFAAEMVSGKDAIQQFGLQALGRGQLRSSGSSFTGKTSAQSAQSQFVTRRAFQPSQQIGASEPLGFFDPLEFTNLF